MSTKYQKLINQDLESKGKRSQLNHVSINRPPMQHIEKQHQTYLGEVLLRGGSAQSIEHHVDYKNFKRGVSE
eukprot:936992-Amorphochlora_amoeboformis.AAC.1